MQKSKGLKFNILIAIKILLDIFVLNFTVLLRGLGFTFLTAKYLTSVFTDTPCYPPRGGGGHGNFGTNILDP